MKIEIENPIHYLDKRETFMAELLLVEFNKIITTARDHTDLDECYKALKALKPAKYWIGKGGSHIWVNRYDRIWGIPDTNRLLLITKR